MAKANFSTPKGALAPRFVVISAAPAATKYTGTRQQLIAAGFAHPDQFPEGRKRVKWDYSMENCRAEGWTVKKLKGDLFELRKNHEYRAEEIPSLKKFEVNYRPDVENKYRWELQHGHWSKLDEQAIREISNAVWGVLETVENSQARAKKNRLTLVNSSPVFFSATRLAGVHHG